VAIGGPTPVQVGTFLRLIAEASGTQMPSLISVPRMLMPFTAPFATMIPGMRLAAQDDLRNLAEDRVVDIAAMRAKLGVEPRLLSQGLAAMFDQSPR
jgi:nucleoside-diphosphate-sugar epimerase